MPTLFLIDGATSIWKADLASYVSSRLMRSIILRKFSTRKLRVNEIPERTDLKFVTETEFSHIDPEYQYRYNGCKYGFSKHDLESALAANENVFLIVRSPGIIKRLRSEQWACNIVTVFIYTDTHEAEKKLPPNLRREIQESAKQAFSDYLQNPDMYDEVLVNGSLPNDFYRLVDLLIRRGGAKSIRSNETNIGLKRARPHKAFTISISRKLREIIALSLGVLVALGDGFFIDMIAQGEWNYWKYVSTAIAGILTVVLLVIGILVVASSDTLDDNENSSR